MNKLVNCGKYVSGLGNMAVESSTSIFMNRILVYALYAVFLVGTASAQSFTYTDGQDNSSPITVPPGSTNNINLTINSGTATQSGLISNIGFPPGFPSGSVTLPGGGTLIFTANNTYTGNTVVNAGTLQLGNNGTGGNVVGSIVNNSSLVFDRSDTVTYGNAVNSGPSVAAYISGTGSVTQSGSGTLILAGLNTYSGTTTISAGTLEITGTLGTGDVIDNASLVFNPLTNIIAGGTFTIFIIGGPNQIITPIGGINVPNNIQRHRFRYSKWPRYYTSRWHEYLFGWNHD